MKNSSKFFPVDLGLFDNSVSEVVLFSLPISGCKKQPDTAQGGMERGPVMWHHPLAQSASARGAFPLLPRAVVLPWPMQEKQVVVAVTVSQDA